MNQDVVITRAGLAGPVLARPLPIDNHKTVEEHLLVNLYLKYNPRFHGKTSEEARTPEYQTA